MKAVTQELRKIVNEFVQKFSGIPDAEFSSKPIPTKWSKKEVLGHLIDSAQNNLRRFICSQYEKTPSKIAYEQDFWVSSNNYQNASKADVIQLWKLMNERICSVLETMPVANYESLCDTGKTETQLYTVQWLAIDYVKHLKHHINQIISGSFDVIYP